jgi:hypothetical protein
MIPLARGLLTSAFVAHLVTQLEDAVLVGRGTAPTDGGWSAGQPGRGTFTPYVVVKTGVARAAANARDPVGIEGYTWDVGYTLLSVGTTDSQADDVADQVRVAVCAFHDRSILSLRDTNWAVDKSAPLVYGPSTRNDSVDPPYWEIADTVSLWLVRSR